MSHIVPPQVDRLQRAGLIVGGFGLLACLLGAFVSPAQFYRSYLFAYLFWTGLGVGCLSIMMINHLSGGMWGVMIRRLLEAGSRTLLFAWLVFLPVALGVTEIYVWASPAKLAADHALAEAVHKKAAFLNVPFFLLRSVFYFACWAALAHLLSKWSREQDTNPTLQVERRLRGLSGGGLVVMGLTISFASVDWAMSLDPQWFSTIYGVLFMVGQALSALAFVIVLIAFIGNERPLVAAVTATAVHDLGKLLLAFVMLWAYVALSQFLITWSANLPEEIPWYIRRLHGGWEWVALLLVVFHFALPFLLLLSRDLKRNARVLALVAGGILVVRMLDLFWMVGPSLKDQGGLAVHWLDVAAALGLGGLWVAGFAWQLKGRPLLPLGDPELREVLERVEA